MGNTPTRELTFLEKSAAVDNIFEQVKIGISSQLAEAIKTIDTHLNLQDAGDIRMFVIKILDHSLENPAFQSNYAKFYKVFNDSLTFEKKKIFNVELNLVFRARFDFFCDFLPEMLTGLKRTIITTTQFYKLELIDDELIQDFISKNYADRKFKSEITRYIVDEAKAKIIQRKDASFQSNRLYQSMIRADKYFTIDDILKQMTYDTINHIVEATVNVNFETNDDFDILVESIIENVARNSNLSIVYANFVKELYDKLSTWMQMVLKDSLKVTVFDLYKSDKILQICNSNEAIRGFAELLAQLYLLNLIQSETIVKILSFEMITKSLGNFYHELLELIVHTVTEESQKGNVSPGTTKLHNICKAEGLIQSPFSNTKESVLIPSTSANARIVNPSTTTKQKSGVFDDFHIKVTTSQPSQLINNQPQIIKNTLVKDFEEYLQTLKYGNTEKFDFAKFNASNEVERRECVQKLIQFGIKNIEIADKVAKVTQSFVTFSVTIDNTTVKDVAKFLTEICDEKLELFKDQQKNWIEIEGLGIFLGNLYALNIQKRRVMYEWLDEAKKFSYENDLALKMFLKVFKIVQMQMKHRDAGNYKIYLKYLEELNKNCSQRIPKLHKNWIDEVLGVSKSQNAQPSTSNLNQNQNLRSSSVASSTSDISTASKTQVSTGAIRKVLPASKTATTEICTEFQKFLNDFDASNETTYNSKLINDASDAAIQGCALLLIEQSLLNKQKIQNYVIMIKSTIFFNINDVSKQMKFKKFLNDYILAEMNRCLKVEKPNTSNWDRVSKLNIFIFELHKFNISETSTVAAWLNRLKVTSSNGCLEAKHEYDICIEKTSERIFQAFLKAIHEKNEVIYPNNILNDASDGRIKNCANNFIQQLSAYPENCKIYIDIINKIILPSFTNEAKRNLFSEHMKKCLSNNIGAVLKVDATNFDRVTKVNLLVCELSNQGLIDAEIVKIWRARLEEMANDNVEANNELKIFKSKIFDKNLVNVQDPQIEVEKVKPNQFNSVSSTNEFNGIERYLNNINEIGRNTFINRVKNISTEKLESFTNFYFKYLMNTSENLMNYVEITLTIESNTKSEFDFKGKISELIMAEFVLHAKNFKTKSAQNLKILRKWMIFIGEFYNEDWIDIEQIHMCLKALAVDNFEAQIQIKLFYEFLKIIGIKLISSGNGVYLKVFYITFETKVNSTSMLCQHSRKLLKDLRKIYESSRLFKSNMDDFLTILKNLNERNIKESAEKFKSMKIYEIDECSNYFVNICIANSENVGKFLRFLAKIGDIEVNDVTTIEKTNFKAVIIHKIQERFSKLIEHNQKPTSEYLKIYKLISNLYKEDIITLYDAMFYLDKIAEIPLNASIEILEYLIPSILVKINCDDIEILDQVIYSLHERSSSENDKERVKKLSTQLRERCSLKEPENSQNFDEIIKDLENITNFSSLATQMKPKIFANEGTMKEFAQAVFNCCINDSYLTELTMKFCKCLIDNEKFKEIFSIFIQLKLISINNDEKIKFNALKLIANCYKIDLIEDETFKPWLSRKIIDDLTYNELSVLSGLIADKNSGDFSYLDELMNEKFMKMCEEIKNDLKNVEISIEKKNDDEEIEAVS